MSEIRTGTCLNNERMLLNFNTTYNVWESHVACNGDIHPEFDGFYLPHVTVENVHADWVRAHATFALLWAGCDLVFLQCTQVPGDFCLLNWRISSLLLSRICWPRQWNRKNVELKYIKWNGKKEAWKKVERHEEGMESRWNRMKEEWIEGWLERRWNGMIENGTKVEWNEGGIERRCNAIQ